MDWIEQFVMVTEGTSAPERFRLWSAISAVAGALERRVYARTSLGVLYPNLYVMLVAKPGVGKCLANHERVLTFDGPSIRADEVTLRTQLMGPDGKPRRVLSLGPGYGPMFRVIPNKGRSWECNGSHILSLRKSKAPDQGTIKHTSVYEWLSWTPAQKAHWKLWRTGINEFAPRDPVPVRAYFVGLLLGDGRRPWQNIEITTDDFEILEECKREAQEWGLGLSDYSKGQYALVKLHGKTNPLLQEIQALGLNVPCHRRFVPEWYKYHDEYTRLEVLAGLMDTDGSYVRHAKCYDFISKSPQLSEDVAFLARSVGLAAKVIECTKTCGPDFIGTYYRVTISGDVNIIPCRVARKQAQPRTQIKNVCNTGFTIIPIGDGAWSGFEVDGDNQYLLDDFTVLHNTEAVRPVEQILTQMSKLYVAPESMTKAALVDTLMDSHRQIIPTKQGEELYEYHSLFIGVSELGTLVTAHDLEFLSVVNRVFDNGKSFRERRRHVNNGKEIQIIHPQLNILAGAQPGFLASILPEEAWLMGFTSRFIMVYAEDGPQIDLFGPITNREPMYKSLGQQLEPWTEMMGPCVWADDAVVQMREIGQGQGQHLVPIPDHPKLESYKTRRVQFLIKLAIISTVSRTGGLVIEALDVTRARQWLLDAEGTMPGIFKGMAIKTDAQVLSEFHIWLWKRWRADKAPIPQSEIYIWLGERVYSERVPKLIDVALKGRLMVDKGMDLYQPVPRLDWTTPTGGTA